jgi:hypothetical protein
VRDGEQDSRNDRTLFAQARLRIRGRQVLGRSAASHSRRDHPSQQLRRGPSRPRAWSGRPEFVRRERRNSPLVRKPGNRWCRQRFRYGPRAAALQVLMRHHASSLSTASVGNAFPWVISRPSR